MVPYWGMCVRVCGKERQGCIHTHTQLIKGIVNDEIQRESERLMGSLILSCLEQGAAATPKVCIPKCASNAFWGEGGSPLPPIKGHKPTMRLQDSGAESMSPISGHATQHGPQDLGQTTFTGPFISKFRPQNMLPTTEHSYHASDGA